MTELKLNRTKKIIKISTKTKIWLHVFEESENSIYNK